MSSRRIATRRIVFVGLLLAAGGLTTGCGDSDFSIDPVSGVVTLDGEPLAGAKISFNPQRQAGSTLVGPGSIAETDESGRYSLKTHKGDRGAVVGPHVVSISTYRSEMVDPENSDEVRKIAEERVPKKYRGNPEFTFEVPAGGTSEADFQLTSD